MAKRRAAAYALAARVALAALAGCGRAAPPTAAETDDTADTADTDDAAGAQPARVAHTRRLLVNTADAIYQVDPVTLDLTRLGEFTFPPDQRDAITDIALDRHGQLWGVGFETIYRIDPATFACAPLARYPGRTLNSLAIVSASTAGREGPDLLITAEAHSAVVSEVDPATGALRLIGDLGAGWAAGGDLSWAPGVGAVMIAIDPAGREGLVRLAPRTFAAQPIGRPWPFAQVRGLTTLPDGLLGVSEAGELIAIDPRTGAGVRRKTLPLVFYGGAIGWSDAPAGPGP